MALGAHTSLSMRIREAFFAVEREGKICLIQDLVPAGHVAAREWVFELSCCAPEFEPVGARSYRIYFGNRPPD
jgi:hypothetical protein